jgi:hypothetical protein
MFLDFKPVHRVGQILDHIFFSAEIENISEKNPG